jgi:hypothetical protein
MFAEGRTDAEKDRLANLMAYGVDPTKTAYSTKKSSHSPTRKMDRFDECPFETFFFDLLISLKLF